jgi:outer membrane protein assembly factor BamB
VSLGILAAGTSGPPGGGDWPQYRQNAQSTWLNPGIFDTSAVAALRPIWTFELGAPGYSSPTIVGDTVYVTTAYHSGKVLALDAATGALKWARNLSATLTTTGCGIFNPGIWDAPAVINGVLYIGSPDGNVYALDASTGATIWASPVAAPAPHGEFLAASPAVSTALGKLYIGTSSITDCDLIPGKIIAVDLATGHSISQSIVAPGRTGGAIWSSITIDEPNGIVYASTGNPPGPPPDDPLSQSIVAFDARTLQPMDHWQDPTFTSFADSDFGASPTLFQAADGTPLVGAPNKDGWLFVLRRGNLSAGPLWKYALAVNGGANNGRGSIVAPSFANGVLYAAGGQTPAGESGSVIAFDPGTGNVLWKHVPPGYVLPGMPTIGNILVVAVTAVGNGSSTLEILDVATGKVLRSFPSTAMLWAAPAVGRGLIVYTNTNGHLTALAVPAYRPDGGTGDSDGGSSGGGADAGGAPPDAGSDAGSDGGTAINDPDCPTCTDQFNRVGSSLGANWRTASGAFFTDGHFAVTTALNSIALWVGHKSTAVSPCTDSRVSVIAVEASEVLRHQEFFGPVVRADPTTPQRAFYGAYNTEDGVVWLFRRSNGVDTVLGHTAPIIDSHAFHTWSLHASGTNPVVLDLDVDGADALTVQDAAAERLGPGFMGMFSLEAGEVDFNNFTQLCSDGVVGPPPTVIFSDSFTGNGPLSNNWVIASGGFTDDGAHAVPTASRSYAVATATAPQAAKVSVTLGLTATSTYNGVLSRANTALPASTHYTAWVNGNGQVWLARRVNFNYTYLGRGPTLVDTTTPRRLSLTTTDSFDGVHLTVAVDGVTQLEVVDGSADAISSAGSAGIFSYTGSGAAFDDFELASP